LLRDFEPASVSSSGLNPSWLVGEAPQRGGCTFYYQPATEKDREIVIVVPTSPLIVRTMIPANGDVLRRKAEAKEMLIVYCAEPLSYTTLCRIVFGPDQSADKAGFAFRILGVSCGS
jgi:hypothetical protein